MSRLSVFIDFGMGILLAFSMCNVKLSIDLDDIYLLATDMPVSRFKIKIGVLPAKWTLMSCTPRIGPSKPSS